MRNPPLILIADDDPSFREIIATKLKTSGFWVAEAVDGKEAFEKVGSLLPDLLIIDIQMPNENGTEAVLDIKRNQETAATKIIFLTSMENPWPGIKADADSFAKELGAARYINKTEDLDKALVTIKEVLEMK